MALLAGKTTVRELIIHFLLPFLVTCCICLRTLSCRRDLALYTALPLCLIWTAVWVLLILNSEVYALITLPMWLGLLGERPSTSSMPSITFKPPVKQFGRKPRMELTLTGLTKTFQNHTAVNNLTLTMDTGVYGLLGVNGAGKTTLMRMLCTLLTPTSGTATWDGQDIFALGASYRSLLGYLPQEFGYYPEFSVQDYLRYMACLKGLRPATAKERTEKLLRQVGLTKVRGRK